MKVQVLKLTLHEFLIGYLLGYKGGKNILVFADEYRANEQRPSFSLITHNDYPNSQKIMQKPWVKSQRLHPSLSNLLPEGALRSHIAQSIKTHVENEFDIFAHLGQDLPGALIATAMHPDDVPASVLAQYLRGELTEYIEIEQEHKFSLAGVQMKFSMREKDGRFNLSSTGEMGNWIVKTPSTRHALLPENEYTAMRLAETVGIEIPEIKLVSIGSLNNLPNIPLPNETLAFAIKRFDRVMTQQNQTLNRVHMEDFAQVMVKYAHEKYTSTNYERVANLVYEYSGDGLADIKKFAKRLLVNILLANGDAHIKNWSLLYADRVTPRLSPAYDILTTSVYVKNEKEFALNLAKTKNWFAVSMQHFKHWATRADLPWPIIELSLNETIDQARSLWPHTLKELPMHAEHKKHLQAHWKKLNKDFRI